MLQSSSSICCNIHLAVSSCRRKSTRLASIHSAQLFAQLVDQLRVAKKKAKRSIAKDKKSATKRTTSTQFYRVEQSVATQRQSNQSVLIRIKLSKKEYVSVSIIIDKSLSISAPRISIFLFFFFLRWQRSCSPPPPPVFGFPFLSIFAPPSSLSPRLDGSPLRTRANSRPSYPLFFPLPNCSSHISGGRRRSG